MNHARLVCNQKEKFQCAECRTLTSNGFQLIGDGETKFVCRDCYTQVRQQYPTVGKSIKQLLPAEEIFSADYDPTAVPESEREPEAPRDTGYIGELVPDGNGGWREPTPEELRVMSAPAPEPPAPRHSPTPSEEHSVLTVKYRFTTDNKLQVILPGRCRIDGTTYELLVTTEG